MRSAVIAAIVAALVSTVGASAATVFVTSKQIKNGTILTQDIHSGAVRSTDLQNGGVRSPDIANGTVASSDIGESAVTDDELAANAVTSDEIGTGQVQSTDIGDGQVTAGDVTLPEPEQMEESVGEVARADVAQVYELVDSVGTYTKQDATSVLQVDWTGSAAAGFAPCVFQIRIDGQPSAGGAGETFVGNGQALSVAASSLFEGLGAGDHSVEIWARIVGGGGAEYPCTVGPAGAAIGQTLVVSEQVV